MLNTNTIAWCQQWPGTSLTSGRPIKKEAASNERGGYKCGQVSLCACQRCQHQPCRKRKGSTRSRGFAGSADSHFCSHSAFRSPSLYLSYSPIRTFWFKLYRKFQLYIQLRSGHLSLLGARRSTFAILWCRSLRHHHFCIPEIEIPILVFLLIPLLKSFALMVQRDSQDIFLIASKLTEL